MENNKDNEYVMSPYITKIVKTSVNGETMWYANKWKNTLLKLKHFFYKTKNHRRFLELSKKKVDASFYMKIPIIPNNELDKVKIKDI